MSRKIDFADEHGHFDFDKYHAHWRKVHPEKQKEYDIRSAAKRLARAGWIVIPPTQAKEGAGND